MLIFAFSVPWQTWPIDWHSQCEQCLLLVIEVAWSHLSSHLSTAILHVSPPFAFNCQLANPRLWKLQILQCSERAWYQGQQNRFQDQARQFWKQWYACRYDFKVNTRTASRFLYYFVMFTVHQSLRPPIYLSVSFIWLWSSNFRTLSWSTWYSTVLPHQSKHGLETKQLVSRATRSWISISSVTIQAAWDLMAIFQIWLYNSSSMT